MASYQPPSEILPIFDNSVFLETNPTSTSGGGLTLAQANLLYLRKNYPDICTALETFNAGISTTFLNASGNIVASGNVTGTSIYGNPITSSIQSLAPTSVLNIATSQTSGILNLCTSAAKTGNINIGTFATGGQLSLGSSSNTQTNLYGGLIYLANATQINGNLTMLSGSITGYLTSALAATTYATIASLSSYLTIASASATYLTQISASTTYATIASLSSYLTTATAAATYLTLISASSTYATIASLSSYLTTATAASTYATIASLSSYLTTATASTTYLSITNASSTYATIASLSSYLTTATAASTYATIASLSSYLTTATAASTYATIASLSSYLTTATAASTYATIASLSSYLTTATAASTYAPINAPTFTTSIGLTSGNINASSGNITASGTVTGTTIALSGASGSITGTYGGVTQTLNNYTIKGTYNLVLDQTNTSGAVRIGATNGAVIIGKIGTITQLVGDLNFQNTGIITGVGDLTSNGTITTSIIKAPTITAVSPTNSISIGGDLTSGIISLGAGNALTSFINIGTGSGGASVYIGSATNTVIINNTMTVLGLFVSNALSTGTVTCSDINTSVATAIFNLAGNQTSGDINIGGSSSFTGNINLGVNASGGSVYIGSATNSVIVNNTMTVLGLLISNALSTGTVTCSGINTSTATATFNLAGNQTSGDVNIAGSSSFSGNINLGINATSGSVYIGNSVSPLRVVGNIYNKSLLSSGITDNVDLYTNNTTGTINFGTNSGRTGAINIGTGSTTSALGITLGNSFNPVTVGGNLTVTGTLTAGSLAYTAVSIDTINSVFNSSTVNLYGNLSSGTLNLGCNTNRTSGINIGTGSTVSSSDIVLGSSNTNTTVNGNLTSTIKVVTPKIEAATAGTAVTLYNTSTGTINFGNTGSTTTMAGALTVTQNLTATGGLTLGSNQGITCGAVPPTLTTSNIGYFYNFALRTNTGLTSSSAGYRYNPSSNTVGAGNFLKAGVYYATINVIYRFTSSPTAFNLNYNFGISSSTTSGAVNTTTNTDISPVSRTNTGSLITGGNNNDSCSSHSLCFTLTTDSFVNTFFNVDVISITGGTLTINQIGTVYRIA
jgi:hypothetical protein